MTLDTETTRRELSQTSGATHHIVNTKTGRALEVMVMARATDLVACAVAREGNCLDLTLGEQEFEIAIDGGKTKADYAAARRIQDFLRG